MRWFNILEWYRSDGRMGNMLENNAGARGEGDKNTKEVKERKKKMIVCVVFEGSLLILF